MPGIERPPSWGEGWERTLNRLKGAPLDEQRSAIDRYTRSVPTGGHYAPVYQYIVNQLEENLRAPAPAPAPAAAPDPVGPPPAPVNPADLIARLAPPIGPVPAPAPAAAPDPVGPPPAPVNPADLIARLAPPIGPVPAPAPAAAPDPVGPPPAAAPVAPAPDPSVSLYEHDATEFLDILPLILDPNDLPNLQANFERLENMMLPQFFDRLNPYLQFRLQQMNDNMEEMIRNAQRGGAAPRPAPAAAPVPPPAAPGPVPPPPAAAPGYDPDRDFLPPPPRMPPPRPEDLLPEPPRIPAGPASPFSLADIQAQLARARTDHGVPYVPPSEPVAPVAMQGFSQPLQPQPQPQQPQNKFPEGDDYLSNIGNIANQGVSREYSGEYGYNRGSYTGVHGQQAPADNDMRMAEALSFLGEIPAPSSIADFSEYMDSIDNKDLQQLITNASEHMNFFKSLPPSAQNIARANELKDIINAGLRNAQERGLDLGLEALPTVNLRQQPAEYGLLGAPLPTIPRETPAVTQAVNLKDREAALKEYEDIQYQDELYDLEQAFRDAMHSASPQDRADIARDFRKQFKELHEAFKREPEIDEVFRDEYRKAEELHTNITQAEGDVQRLNSSSRELQTLMDKQAKLIAELEERSKSPSGEDVGLSDVTQQRLEIERQRMQDLIEEAERLALSRFDAQNDLREKKEQLGKMSFAQNPFLLPKKYRQMMKDDREILKAFIPEENLEEALQEHAQGYDVFSNPEDIDEYTREDITNRQRNLKRALEKGTIAKAKQLRQQMETAGPEADNYADMKKQADALYDSYRYGADQIDDMTNDQIEALPPEEQPMVRERQEVDRLIDGPVRPHTFEESALLDHNTEKTIQRILGVTDAQALVAKMQDATPFEQKIAEAQEQMFEIVNGQITLSRAGIDAAKSLSLQSGEDFEEESRARHPVAAFVKPTKEGYFPKDTTTVITPQEIDEAEATLGPTQSFAQKDLSWEQNLQELIKENPAFKGMSLEDVQEHLPSAQYRHNPSYVNYGDFFTYASAIPQKMDVSLSDYYRKNPKAFDDDKDGKTVMNGFWKSYKPKFEGAQRNAFKIGDRTFGVFRENGKTYALRINPLSSDKAEEKDYREAVGNLERLLIAIHHAPPENAAAIDEARRQFVEAYEKLPAIERGIAYIPNHVQATELNDKIFEGVSRRSSAEKEAFAREAYEGVLMAPSRQEAFNKQRNQALYDVIVDAGMESMKEKIPFLEGDELKEAAQNRAKTLVTKPEVARQIETAITQFVYDIKTAQEKIDADKKDHKEGFSQEAEQAKIAGLKEKVKKLLTYNPDNLPKEDWPKQPAAAAAPEPRPAPAEPVEEPVSIEQGAINSLNNIEESLDPNDIRNLEDRFERVVELLNPVVFETFSPEVQRRIQDIHDGLEEMIRELQEAAPPPAAAAAPAPAARPAPAAPKAEPRETLKIPPEAWQWM